MKAAVVRDLKMPKNYHYCQWLLANRPNLPKQTN